MVEVEEVNIIGIDYYNVKIVKKFVWKTENIFERGKKFIFATLYQRMESLKKCLRDFQRLAKTKHVTMT
jgi:hypothetical protein